MGWIIGFVQFIRFERMIRMAQIFTIYRDPYNLCVWPTGIISFIGVRISGIITQTATRYESESESSSTLVDICNTSTYMRGLVMDCIRLIYVRIRTLVSFLFFRVYVCVCILF